MTSYFLVDVAAQEEAHETILGVGADAQRLDEAAGTHAVCAIVDLDGRFVIECKCIKWTDSGYVPSAKMAAVNEAAFYLSFLPDSYCKYIVMKYCYHSSRGETLAEYYFRTYRHLLGDIKVGEYDPDSGSFRVICE